MADRTFATTRRLGGRLPPGNVAWRAVTRLEDDDRLGAAARAVHRVAMRVRTTATARDLLSGTWLGHPVHPMLTDLPIGFWTSAWVLDLVGPRRHREAARVLVGLGVLSALPAAATGASDWRDTTGRAQRVGLVHAAANSTAAGLYLASWLARRRGHTARGIALGMAGATAATVGGYLGGHLTQVLGVGVDAARVPDALTDWTRALDEEAVTTAPTRVRVDGVELMVFRVDTRVVAMGAVCPHRGAPLEEGTVDDGCVECPWHGSRFRIDDGALVRGPAATPLVPFEAREDGAGGIEVRRVRAR
jgi:nitrite reductase/ring-hydroxylating ferredoxin subunit/uncharacterized membrane protein